MIIEYLNEIMTVQKGLDTFLYRYQILVGASLGILLVILRNVPQILWNRFINTVTIKLVIDESENMAGHGFKVFNSWIKDNRLEWLTRSFEVDVNQNVVGGGGFTAFFYQGKLFWTTMERRETKGTTMPVTIGAYVLHTMKWNRALLDLLVTESCTAKPIAMTAAMYIPRSNDRYLDNGVCFPTYVKEQQQYISEKTYRQLHDVFSRFAKGPESYLSRGTAYKETIMLFGPPGTGKTNLLRHLPALFNFDLVVIDPGSISATSFNIKTWNNPDVPRVFVIEDINSNKSYHVQPDQKSVVDGNAVIVHNSSDSVLEFTSGGGSLNDLLNSLDGVVPMDNCIVILTSNRLSQLEPAIYRPGRVDHLVHMDYMDYNGVLDILKWSVDDERLTVLANSQNRDQLPAATINRLRYAQTAQEVMDILADKNTALGMVTYVRAA